MNLNKNVRWATVYDPDDDFPEPAEDTDMIRVLTVGVAKFSHAVTLKVEKTP